MPSNNKIRINHAKIKKSRGIKTAKLSDTQNYCHRSAICVKCSEGHRTEDCPKPKKTKSKCANCNENHSQ
jgi:hypothetical protein